MLVAAELQARINQFSCPDLPSLQETLRTRIGSTALSQREKDDVLDVLERCPQGDTVFHGDFHPGNLMKTDRGIYAIDWFNAHHAHPAADIARTSLLLRTAVLPDTLSIKVRTLIEKARTAVQGDPAVTSRCRARPRRPWSTPDSGNSATFTYIIIPTTFGLIKIISLATNVLACIVFAEKASCPED